MEADLGRPLLEPETRSPDPAICPFLRALDGDRLIEPAGRPDDANRCLATGPAIAQDLAWQAATCLSGAHVTCARYLSGSAALDRAAPAVAASTGTATSAAAAAAEAGDAADAGDAGSSIRSSRTMTPAVVLSLVLLVASAAAAITYVGATGGLQLPTTAPSPVALASAGPTIAASPGPTAAATSGPTPVPTATVEPAPTPMPTATTSGPTPAPTSSRYALLTPCPSKPDCYRYTVRSGDNLRSIANYFGVPYDTVLALNPSIKDPATIQPGTVLTLPPPTR